MIESERQEEVVPEAKIEELATLYSYNDVLKIAREQGIQPASKKKMLSEIKGLKSSESDNVCQLLKEKYGVTESFDCAGFITQKGELINSCVNEHHAEHEEMVPDHGKLTKYLKDCCDIRFRKQGKRIWVESECKPTSEQIEKIVESIRDCDILYAYGPKECLLGLSNPKPLHIHTWIHKCFS